MSHRTEELQPLSGFRNTLREWRYHEVARQAGAVVLILLYALTSEPLVPLAAPGLAAAVIGTAIRLYASGFIMKNRELATDGPYALVRHPLYTGNILVLFGLALANATWWAIPLAVLFCWFYYPPAVEYEDRKLRRLFGADWERWAADTPALVPDLRKLAALSTGEWSLAKSLRQNGEIAVAVYVVICIALILTRF